MVLLAKKQPSKAQGMENLEAGMAGNATGALRSLYSYNYERKAKHSASAFHLCCRSPAFQEHYETVLYSICLGIVLSCAAAALPFAYVIILIGHPGSEDIKQLLFASVAVSGVNTIWLAFVAALLRHKMGLPRFCPVGPPNTADTRPKIGSPKLVHSTNQRLAPVAHQSRPISVHDLPKLPKVKNGFDWFRLSTSAAVGNAAVKGGDSGEIPTAILETIDPDPAPASSCVRACVDPFTTPPRSSIRQVPQPRGSDNNDEEADVEVASVISFSRIRPESIKTVGTGTASLHTSPVTRPEL